MNDDLSPDGIDRTIVKNVNRDGGNTVTASDWFSECELDLLSANSINFIGLFVDQSGSMTRSTVRASYNKFLADLTTAGIASNVVTNGVERWVDPFLADLAP